MTFSGSESDDDSPHNHHDEAGAVERLRKLRQKEVVGEFRHERQSFTGSLRAQPDNDGTLSGDEEESMRPSFSNRQGGDAMNQQSSAGDTNRVPGRKRYRERDEPERLSDDEGPSESKAAKSVAERLMEKMGYKEGTGLGKNKQGIAAPIQVSTQRGRTGMGHEGAKKLGSTIHEAWDDTQEKKEVEEHPQMMPPLDDEDRELEVERAVQSQIMIAEAKLSIDDEIDVVDQEILKKLLEAKNVFDHLDDRRLREARARANPYETIASGIFQNRAAMKAANMDGVFDFCFSQEVPEDLERKCPLDINRKGTNELHRKLPLYYFADVCAGPGGFSEYALWRKGFYNAKGFGFTLKGRDDFKLTKFLASSPLFFEPYYGVHDDGDVTRPENIDAFEEVVMKGTDGMGVHLMMADGGFSVEGQENIQEIVSKRIYLCQLLVSLCIVREGGNFYCKLFDVFTRFSYELVFLMRLCYREVCIHKPHTSRPANSERYIVCKGLMHNYSDRIRDFLKNVNREMEKLWIRDGTISKVEKMDITQILPNHFGNELTDCEQAFLEYMMDSNNMIARRQIHYLEKYRVFSTNQGLIDKDQADLREKCMRYWRVPYDMQHRGEREQHSFRTKYREEEAFQVLSRYSNTMFGDKEWSQKPLKFEDEKVWKPLFFDRKPKELVHEEFRCVWATADKANQSQIAWPKLLVSTADAVFTHGYTANTWDRHDKFEYRVPENTVLLVDVVAPMVKDGGKVRLALNNEKKVLRIVDAAVLAGDDISGLKYDTRMECVEKFCKAVNLAENKVFVSIPRQQINQRGRGRGGNQNRMQFERKEFRPHVLTPATVFRLDEVSQNLPTSALIYNEEVALIEENGYTYMCPGMHMFRYIKDDWSMFFSKTSKQCYAFKAIGKVRQSVFSDQFESSGCVTTFWDSAILKKPSNRMFWSWMNNYSDNYGIRTILKNEHETKPTVVSLENLMDQMKEEAQS